MSGSPLTGCQALAFDLFGTVLDLHGSLIGDLTKLLRERSAASDPGPFWQAFRQRQRLEQYQDTLLGLGHSGYLETVKRAFRYTARCHGFDPDAQELESFMKAWRHLHPYPECVAALQRLRSRFRLVALSNGNAWLLEHLAKNQIGFDFDLIFSVDTVGAFKPTAGVYRRAAQEAGLEMGQIIMVSANSFDVLGARSAGMRAVYVNRNHLPVEDTVPKYAPDATVADFSQLASLLLE